MSYDGADDAARFAVIFGDVAALNKPKWEALFLGVHKRPNDDAAWSALYITVWPYLTDWILSRYRIEPGRAGDVIQDAFLQYRAKLIAGSIDRPSLPHLRAFVRFCVLTLLRAESRLVALDDISPSPAPGDPEQDLIHKLIIDEALERIDQRCAHILRAKYFHGKTSAEIATALRLEPGYVDVLLHRCRAQCREILSNIGSQLSEPK